MLIRKLKCEYNRDRRQKVTSWIKYQKNSRYRGFVVALKFSAKFNENIKARDQRITLFISQTFLIKIVQELTIYDKNQHRL